MQLTKDDVTTEYEIFKLQAEDKLRNKDIFKLDFWKFQKVVAFYEKYRGSPEYFANDFPDNEWWKQNETKYRKLNTTSVPSRDFYEGHYKLRCLIEEFNDWLFSYCFKDGLK